TTRFVGSEPYSPVTQLYNEAMAAVFSPELELIVIDRLKINQSTVSATKVRKAIAEKDLLSLQQFLPETTFSFLMQHNYI
ncbi:[citrate (pro-3S)-lyase] ligase, partial [Listeria monocytogenes]|nr:[citrate (pro-3S)-lyase] ligase [Listeria monocytogenes]